MQSYADSSLILPSKYIKLNASIPVPEVFACCTKLKNLKGNDVRVRSSYILISDVKGPKPQAEPSRAGAVGCVKPWMRA